MRSNPEHYEMASAKNLPEALQMLHDEPGVWAPFAGGTDLMVLYEAGLLKKRKLLNLLQVQELNRISEDKDFLSLGSLCTYTQIRKNRRMQQLFPNLCAAAKETGAIGIQNRGTLGGNIANASPAADSPPALLAYDAELELQSLTGSRWIRYSKFHTGYKQTQLRQEEIITQIRLPKGPREAFHYYRKVGTRKAQAISKVCLAGFAVMDGEKLMTLRIGMGSIAPVPYRCHQTEAILVGQTLSPDLIQKAKTQLAQEIAPIADIRSNAEFRVRVSQNLLGEFLSKRGSLPL